MHDEKMKKKKKNKETYIKPMNVVKRQAATTQLSIPNSNTRL